MMKKQFFSPSLLLLIFFLLCTKISGQPSSSPAASPSPPTTVPAQSSPPPSPAAPAPSSSSVPGLVPSGAPASNSLDIITILKKAGKFTTFIGLLKTTQLDSEINNRLKKSDGITLFAPTDAAFSNLKTGTLNSFTDQQKTALARFHLLFTFLTVPQFQTVSNPVHTAADGDTAAFPLNVIGDGKQVNLTTGLVNTTVDSTVYIDGKQLAVYEIGEVLLSEGVLGGQAPATAPAPLLPKPEKASSPASSHGPPGSTAASVDSSGATTAGWPAGSAVTVVVSVGLMAVIAAFPFCM